MQGSFVVDEEGWGEEGRDLEEEPSSVVGGEGNHVTGEEESQLVAGGTSVQDKDEGGQVAAPPARNPRSSRLFSLLGPTILPSY